MIHVSGSTKITQSKLNRRNGGGKLCLKKPVLFCSPNPLLMGIFSHRVVFFPVSNLTSLPSVTSYGALGVGVIACAQPFAIRC